MKKFFTGVVIVTLFSTILSIQPNASLKEQPEYEGIIVKYKKTHKEERSKVRSHKKLKNHLKLEISDANIDVFSVDSEESVSSVISEINKYDGVEFAQPDYTLYPLSLPNDPSFNLQWSLKNTGQKISSMEGTPGIDINITEFWDYSQGSQEVLVAIVDTGMDIHHPEIKEKVFRNNLEIPGDGIDNDKNGYIDDINGWNFYDNNNNLYDSSSPDWHGTGIGGVIAATQNNSSGISGIAPDIKILPVKYLGGTKGEAKTSSAIIAIEYARKMGAKIINCSWGSDNSNPALKQTIEKYPDMLFICAAGNYGNNTKTYPIYPACLNLPNIISVAAIDNNGLKTDISNYGTNIDLAAPGKNVYSIMPDNKYGYISGTSIAVPHVTGVAALLKTLHPDITPQLIKQNIISSVTKLDGLQEVVSSSGMLNAFGALKNSYGGNLPNNTIYTIGDVNEDEKVDSTDYAHIKRYVLGISELPTKNILWAADLNGDAFIDSVDLAFMKRYLLGIGEFPKQP